jgi:hypothetical protein
MRLVTQSLLVYPERNINIIVSPEPGVFRNVFMEGLANALRESFNAIVCPLLAHGNSKSMQCVERFCSKSTALKVDGEEFWKLRIRMRAREAQYRD